MVVSAARVEFAGFTAATFNGDLGGYPGANQKCQAEFAGSYFCTIPDYDGANTTALPGASGAWIDSARAPSGARNNNSCSATGNTAWTLGTTASSGVNLNAVGSFYASTTCSFLKPLACCQSR